MASLGPAPAGLAPSSDASAKALLVDWRDLKIFWLCQTGENHGKPVPSSNSLQQDYFFFF